MKVSKDNVPVYFERNTSFNSAMEGLVQDIFQHHTVGDTGYVAVRPSSSIPVPEKINKSIPTSSKSSDLESKLDRFDLSGLGEYERRIFTSLVTGKYATVVLIGDMGSGKTATINFLTEVIKRPRSRTCGLCEKCDPVVIKMNFNAGFQDDDPRVVLRTFRWNLYHKLRHELRHLFTVTKLTDALLEEIKDPDSGGDYAAFDRFEQAHSDVVKWNLKTDDEKADLLFTYVDECTNDGTENIVVIMSLVYLTKRKLRSDPACLILIFDNIDAILPEAQYKLLSEILQYQETARVQSLVTLRRANFSKFEENSAAHAFGTVDHIGPDIKEVVMKRLNYYAENWQSLPEVIGLDNAEYARAVKNRIDYLINTELEAFGGIQRITSICGSSIRQGLYMCERFIINSAVPFDEDPRYRNDIVRAALVENGKSNEISPEDHCVANLLLNKASGEASLLNIRILQLVAAMESEASNRFSKLLDMLKAIGFIDKEEVITALNYLLYMRRPLLWVDGKTRYNKQTIEEDYDDVLHLTESGYFYLRELMLDLVYVQEAALSVSWREGNIPTSVNYSIAVQRFQVLRLCLEDLAEQDHKETKNLKRWLATKGTGFSIRPILFVNRMIAALGRAALYILLPRIEDPKLEVSEQMKHENIEELKNWQSTINVWLEKERRLTQSSKDKSGRVNKKLEQLSEEYRLRLMLKQ